MNRKMALSVFLGVLTLLLGTPSFASDFPDYSAQQLKAMMDRGDRIFLLCPLADIVFNEKNIPRSVNIPLKEIMKTTKMPKDKNTQIITYCLGPK
jgi:hypothetical protein